MNGGNIREQCHVHDDLTRQNKKVAHLVYQGL